MSAEDELVRVTAMFGLRVVGKPQLDVLKPAVRDVIEVRGGRLNHEECAFGNLRDYVVGESLERMGVTLPPVVVLACAGK